MNQAEIYITPKIAHPSNPEGVIGSYKDETGKEIRGIELIDVIAQVKQFPQAKSFLVHVQSPGGLVDTGDSIYDYLESLKAQGISVNTITDGDVGSIATKPFLAGTTRTIVEGHELFIHNPWTQPQPGDSNQITMELHALKQKEVELRAFYQKHTNITDIGLKGLMDKETGMNADQAVTLGFATQKIGKKIKAFALLKNSSTMSNEKSTVETLAKKVTDILKEAVGIKAEVPALPVTPAAAAETPGAPLLIDGAPAPDGVYTVTVTGGMISKVDPAAAEESPAPEGSLQAQGNPQLTQALEKITALEQANTAQAKELAELKAVDVNAVVTKAIDDFKASHPGLGKTPTRAINTNGLVNTNRDNTHRSINDAMAQKREERKKQINKN